MLCSLIRALLLYQHTIFSAVFRLKTRRKWLSEWTLRRLYNYKYCIYWCIKYNISNDVEQAYQGSSFIRHVNSFICPVQDHDYDALDIHLNITKFIRAMLMLKIYTTIIWKSACGCGSMFGAYYLLILHKYLNCEYKPWILRTNIKNPGYDMKIWNLS